jgi:hypothetical protein
MRRREHLLPDIYPVVIVLSIHSSCHPSKFLIPEEEDGRREEEDGRRGGGRMTVAAVYYSKIILKEN